MNANAELCVCTLRFRGAQTADGSELSLASPQLCLYCSVVCVMRAHLFGSEQQRRVVARHDQLQDGPEALRAARAVRLHVLDPCGRETRPDAGAWRIRVAGRRGRRRPRARAAAAATSGRQVYLKLNTVHTHTYTVCARWTALKVGHEDSPIPEDSLQMYEYTVFTPH